ncbi:MAG TPA: hypothetical protein VEU98_09055, partial [Candidatus Eremiobacteraceae bacterium]|nr:hypothetical protein [Candidatus Eremiobacteraceae bacterium]
MSLRIAWTFADFLAPELSIEAILAFAGLRVGRESKVMNKKWRGFDFSPKFQKSRPNTLMHTTYEVNVRRPPEQPQIFVLHI